MTRSVFTGPAPDPMTLLDLPPAPSQRAPLAPHSRMVQRLRRRYAAELTLLPPGPPVPQTLQQALDALHGCGLDAGSALRATIGRIFLSSRSFLVPNSFRRTWPIITPRDHGKQRFCRVGFSEFLGDSRMLIRNGRVERIESCGIREGNVGGRQAHAPATGWSSTSIAS